MFKRQIGGALALAGAFTLCLATDSSDAQSPPDFFNFFGGLLNAALVDNARREWLSRPAYEHECLNRHGLSAENLALQGVVPFDPRIRHLMIECASAQRVVPAAPQMGVSPSPNRYNSNFIVDGVALGSVLQPEYEPASQYNCKASEQFPGFTWCRRSRTETSAYGPHSSFVSALRSPAGNVVYVSQSISPAVFTSAGIDKELNRLSHEFGLTSNIMRQKSNVSGADGFLVTWGSLALTPLDDGAMADLREGRPIQKGLLFDFLGNARRSARENMPVYSAGGGPGFVWGATIEEHGENSLRITSIDPQALRPSQPSSIASPNPVAPVPLESTGAPGSAAQPPAPQPELIVSEVPLKRDGSMLLLPVTLNGAITLNFMIDSGASDVSIPADVVSTLMRTNTLTKDDFIGTESYRLADGSVVPSPTFRIRSLKVGDREIVDVKCNVAKAEGPLLLGQSFLSRFKSWSINNERQTLVLAR